MKKVILMLAVAAMASCAKSELTERPAVDGDQVELKLTSKVLGIESRTPFEGEIGSGNDLTARVLASTVSGTYLESSGDSFVANGTVTFSEEDTAEGFTPKAYYPVDATKTVYVFGLHPANTWTIEGDGSKASYDIDGKSDIMVASEQTTLKANAKSGTYAKLQFKHLLAKYDIKVVAEDDAAIEAWGKIKNIELTKGLNGNDPQNKCEVTFNDAENPTFSGTGVINFYLVNDGSTYTDTQVGIGSGDTDYITLTKNPTLAAYAMVAPIKPTAITDYITLTVFTEKSDPAGENVQVKLTSDGSNPVMNASTAGNSYEITLTFKATELKVEGAVTDWTTGGKGSGELQ